MAKLELKKPIMIDGKETKEIEYDLDALTGENIQFAIKELGKRGIIVTMSETDMNYHAMIFSIAADMQFEDMKRFGIKDYNAACTAVRDFFLEE